MSRIKECFPSRFEGGVILEADFSQLEVIGVAVLSKDSQLIDDILSGMDMHRVRAAELFKKPQEEVTDKERTIVKRFSFMLQYGATPKGMAKKLEVKVDIAEGFERNYYNRYQGLAKWQDMVAEEVRSSRRPSDKTTFKGRPAGIGTYESVTGRIYTFVEKDRGDDTAFNLPEMKNYPSQGFATGDVMALYRGQVYRRLIRENLLAEALPVNTVHDSVMFDCRNLDVATRLKAILQEEAARLPALLMEYWDLEVPVSFKIEVKAGPTWASTEKI